MSLVTYVCNMHNTLKITECNPNKLKRTIVVFVIVLQKVKMGLKVVKKLTCDDKKLLHLSIQKQPK